MGEVPGIPALLGSYRNWIAGVERPGELVEVAVASLVELHSWIFVVADAVVTEVSEAGEVAEEVVVSIYHAAAVKLACSARGVLAVLEAVQALDLTELAKRMHLGCPVLSGAILPGVEVRAAVLVVLADWIVSAAAWTVQAALLRIRLAILLGSRTRSICPSICPIVPGMGGIHGRLHSHVDQVLQSCLARA